VNDDEFAELFKKLSSGQSTGASWGDVAAEFESLGKTFGDVVRRAWQSQGDLFAATPETAQARDQFARIVESLQQTADTATAELRPELLNLLRQANVELRRHSGLDDNRA
jgi:hypothetical protein